MSSLFESSYLPGSSDPEVTEFWIPNPVDYRKLRKLIIRSLVIAGIVIIATGAVIVWRNRRDLLYTSDYMPIFSWLPDNSDHGLEDLETGEIRPRNINSIWQ